MQLKSSSYALSTETFRPRLAPLMCVLVGLCTGAVAVLSAERIGLWSVPLFAFLVLAISWLVREPFRLFLWYLVTVPFVSPYVNLEMPVGVPDISYDRVILLMIFVVIFIDCIFYGMELPKVSSFFLAVFVITLLGQARLFAFGSMADDEASRIVSVFVPFAVYWLTKCLVVSRSKLQSLLTCLIVAALLICLSGLVEQVLNLEYSLFARGEDLQPLPRSLDAPGGRAAGVMTNPAAYGATVGMGMLVCIGCYFYTLHCMKRLLLGASIAFLFYGVLACYTRGAWLAVLASLVVAQFYLKGLRRPLLLLSVCCILAVGFFYGDLQSHEVVQERVLETDNVVGRYERTVFGANKFLAKPIFGWGPGGYNELIKNSRQYGFGGFSSSHNALMTMCVDGGLVYVLTVFALFLFWIKRAHAVAKEPPPTSLERHAVVAFASFIVIWIFSAMTVEMRYFSYLNSLLFMAGAVIERMTEISGPEPNVSQRENWVEG